MSRSKPNKPQNFQKKEVEWNSKIME